MTRYAIMRMAKSGAYGEVVLTTTSFRKASAALRDYNTDSYTGQCHKTYALVVVPDGIRKGDELLYRRHGSSDYSHGPEVQS